MLHAFIRFGDGSVSTEATPENIERAFKDERSLFWVDFDQCDQELKLLDSIFHFHPLAIEDALGHVERAKIDRYLDPDPLHPKGYVYLVVHGPDLERTEALRTKELDCFLSDRYLLTMHERRLRACEETVQHAGKDPNRFFDLGSDGMLHAVLDRLIDEYEPILDTLQEQIDRLEEVATLNPRPELLRKISREKRELMELRRTVGPSREVLAQLTRGEVPFIRESVRLYLRDVSDHLNRVVESIEMYRDLVTSARDIYLSSLSNNLNQIMKTLTAITVIFLPLNLVTGFFGMNLEIPGIHSHIAFWLAMAAMLGASMTLAWWLKRKRWL